MFVLDDDVRACSGSEIILHLFFHLQLHLRIEASPQSQLQYMICSKKKSPGKMMEQWCDTLQLSKQRQKTAEKVVRTVYETPNYGHQ
jgi:hypothetical protein